MSYPIIGITLDWQEEGSFSSGEHYALRTHYFDAVAKAGGVPLGIPYHSDAITQYVDKCDGFLSPGGECASPTEWYVDKANVSPYEASPRVVFELELLRAFLEADKPVLGICQGMQQLGAISGCKMTGNIQSYLNTDIQHPLNGRNPNEYAYDISIKPDTLLYSIVGKNKLPVNTAHREALVSASDRVVISAKSADGCIQAIELPNYKFALGVQWHPEYFINAEEQGHLQIFKALVNASL